MKKKFVSILVCLCMMTFLLTGCGQKEEVKDAQSDGGTKDVTQEASQDEKEPVAKDGLTFKVIPMNTASDYWLALKAGAEAAAKELGDEYGGITIEFDGPQSNADINKQLSILENAVTAKLDGVLIAALNPETFSEPIQNAIDAGVPVITVDDGVEPNTALSFIATDNYAATTLLGEYISELAGGKGKFAMIANSTAHSSDIDRPQGFQDGMEGKGDWECVGKQLAYGDIQKAESMTLNFMQSNPDINVMFASNDRGSIGVCNAFIQLGIKDDVKVCSVDITKDTLQYMRDGYLSAAVLQRPYDMGYQGVESLLKHLEGEELEKVVDTGVFLLTPDKLGTDEATEAIQQYMPDYKGEE